MVTAGPTESPQRKIGAGAQRGSGIARLDAVTWAVCGMNRCCASWRRWGSLRMGLCSTAIGRPSAGIAAAPGGAFGHRSQRAGQQVGVALRLDGVQPGDQVLVYADVPDQQAAQVVLRGRENQTETIGVATVEVPRPLPERAWVGRGCAAFASARYDGRKRSRSQRGAESTGSSICRRSFA